MKTKGFTLIEIIVACAIFLILMLGVFQVMDIGRSAWHSGDVSVELRREIIRAFTRMERDLKETRASETSLSSGASSPTLTFKIPQDNDNDSTVLDSAGSVEWSGNITYSLNGSNQIIRADPWGATSVLANNVTVLQFTRPLSLVDILQIDITVSKVSAIGGQMQDSGQILIKMRN